MMAHYQFVLYLLATACHLVVSVRASISSPWESFIYAPSSRFPIPQSVHKLSGGAVAHGHDISLYPSSQVTLDFGREVAGDIRFHITSPAADSPVSLAYTESPQFIGAWSDDTGASRLSDWDQALNVSLPATAVNRSFLYTTPPERFRGGFRYLTITASSRLPGKVIISNVTCLLGFHPGVDNPRAAYRGYFFTPNDELLVRTWYAGAYTVQTNIAPPNTGRYLPQIRPGWAYNATLGVDGPILLDGAKRDRAVWPGDLGVSAPSSFLAFGPKFGYECVYNALETLFYYQNATTGMFPFAGPDTNSFRSGSKSDTYHAWSMVAIADYALYSGNDSWVNLHWKNMTRAVDFIIDGLGAEGLQFQAWPNDWARQGGGDYNSALNAIAYGALKSFSRLADSRSPKLSISWDHTAERLKRAYNSLLWNEAAGLYRDNRTTSLHPQDGNALAVYFNLTTSPEQQKRVSKGLTRNWNDIGPVTPELPDTISPFVSSWEVEAHFIANEPDRALDLVRRLWGYSLDGPNMGGTTVVEGLSANGSLYYRSEAGYNYDPAYTSMAHSWSTGPTSSLITRLLGLRITTDQGRTWEMKPTLGAGGLRHVQGGFETPLGRFEAEWRLLSGGHAAVVRIKSPKGTRGRFIAPFSQFASSSFQTGWIEGTGDWIDHHIGF